MRDVATLVPDVSVRDRQSIWLARQHWPLPWDALCSLAILKKESTEGEKQRRAVLALDKSLARWFPLGIGMIVSPVGEQRSTA